jgi:hypothetical protein
MKTRGATLKSLKELLPENVTPATELYGGKTAAELYGTKGHHDGHEYMWCYHCYDHSYCMQPGMEGDNGNKDHMGDNKDHMGGNKDQKDNMGGKDNEEHKGDKDGKSNDDNNKGAKGGHA